jgi:CHAT domain-containing protein/tetratricopeptide (TPR) repeat protein
MEGMDLYSQGRQESYKAAVEKWQESFALWQKIDDKYGEALSLYSSGDAYDVVQDRERALKSFFQALALWRAIADLDGEATVLNSIGRDYDALGEKQKALDCYNQALPLGRAVSDRGGEAVTLTGMGKVYDDLGERQKALDCYDRALPLQRAVRDRDDEAVTLNNIGMVYSALGERQKALYYFGQALQLIHTIGDRAHEAVTLNNIGLVYEALGERQKALHYYNQALPLRRAAGDRNGEARTLNNIGGIYDDLGEEKKALDYYSQALPLYRAVDDRDGEATALNNIGLVYQALGEEQKALDYYNQVWPLVCAVGDRDGEARTLNNIGVAYDSLGEKQKALDYCNQALPIERAVGDRANEANTSRWLMLEWDALSKPRLAVLYGKHAVNLYQGLRANIQGLSKETQRTYLKTVEGVYRELADILAGQGRLWEAEQVLELLKEEEYFEYVRRDRAMAQLLEERVDLTPAESTDLALYEKKADEIETIGHRVEELQALRNRTAEQEAELGQLNKELETANKAFQVVLRQIADDLGGALPARDVVRDLQATQGLAIDLSSLGGGITILSTVVAEKRVWVILTTPTVQVAGKTDIDEADLDRKVLAFRQTLTDPQSDPRPEAREFYDLLIKPVEGELAAAKPKMVAWMLDGMLRYLPVTALYDGERYLVERFANVELTPASRSRLELEPAATWRALGLGVSEAHEGFKPLPDVPQELQAVVHEAGSPGGALPGVRLLDEKFTRQALEGSRGAGYQVIHIASHFDCRGTDEDSFLLLGDGSHLTVKDIRAEGGLFRGVELLTLSACNTAMGEERKDGREVDGLGEYAQNQGARAVMATLWPVADVSTAELMAAFYRLKEQRLSKAEALRQAQLTLLKGSAPPQNTGSVRGITLPPGTTVRSQNAGYSHPFYWAPFILIGNWK